MTGRYGSEDSAPQRKGVTVTITPAGLVMDVAINGHSIGSAIPARGAELTLRHGDLPLLSVTLIADEVIVQPKEATS